ncbi:MAG TPA: hypothetical protein VNO52_00555 [Methylomirabilota bacterium]|nr:hypothetical protein [Methylomirabilota bacterium]
MSVTSCTDRHAPPRADAAVSWTTQPPRWDDLANAVIVAGHAVFLGEGHDDATDPRRWYLLPYQVGEVPCYLEHVRVAVEQAAADPRALLIFSGGQTRAEAGPRSEALGYWRIAAGLAWWGHAEVAARCAVEDYSRDSFENLLFGLCRFFECTGRYPERVTVVSWAFKRERFDHHRAALRLPRDRFQFIGPNDPPARKTALQGEAATLALFARDPYGALPGGALDRKRGERNPFRRQPAFSVSNPALRELLQHRGPALFPGPLPWDPS